ncbi:MAG TPA: hypothetical protein VE778_06160 [Candidatus Bathyarchaeia archaeon]|jgi:hypothetical protein|nr:hypothetical protein [Candidatus Bathyarchaeia archaeon]
MADLTQDQLRQLRRNGKYHQAIFRVYVGMNRATIFLLRNPFGFVTPGKTKCSGFDISWQGEKNIGEIEADLRAIITEYKLMADNFKSQVEVVAVA